MLMKALGSSQHRGVTAEFARLSGEAMPSLTGSARAEYERRLGVAVHAFSGSVASAARAFSRRGVWRSDRRATRRSDTDFRTVAHIEDELEAFRGGSALSGLGRGKAGRQWTRG